MSYILEALKKSDQERSKNSVPDLQTLHIPAQLEQSSPRWPYVVIILLLLSLAFVIGWMQPWRQTSPEVTMHTPATSAAEPVVVREVVDQQPAPAVADQDSTQADTAIPEVKQAKPEVERQLEQQEPRALAVATVEQQIISANQQEISVPSLEIESVPHLSEMPSLVQQAIPDMTFAGHVYSTNAAQRSVIINGHSMGEGDTVIQGLVVEQITSNGIVFNYQDQLFRMEILQDWSFD